LTAALWLPHPIPTWDEAVARMRRLLGRTVAKELAALGLSVRLASDGSLRLAPGSALTPEALDLATRHAAAVREHLEYERCRRPKAT
jgi:hypothetical protein